MATIDVTPMSNDVGLSDNLLVEFDIEGSVLTNTAPCYMCICVNP